MMGTPRAILAGAVGALCALAAANAVAAPTDAFKANYTVSKSGLPLGDAHFSLAPGTKNGCYVYAGHAKPNALVKMFLGDIHDESRFCVVDGEVRPEHFKHHIDGKPHDSYTLDFDWSTKTVRYADEAGDHKTYKLTPGTQDPMSLQIAARRWLASNKGENGALPGARTFKLADDHGVEDYRVAVSKAGTLKTPAGRFDTVKLARRGEHDHALTFWLAENADWIPVQVRRLDDGDSRYTLTIQSLSSTGH